LDPLATAAMIAALVTLLSIGSAHAQFTESAAAVGLDTLASKEGGLCWGFLDDDDRLDVVVLIHGGARIYRNAGDTFTDVTAETSPFLSTATLSGGRACVLADMDNDGDADLVRTAIASNDTALGITGFEVYANGGAPDFRLGTATGPDFAIRPEDMPGYPVNIEGIATIDLDRDGFLDLAVQSEAGLLFFHNAAGGGIAFTRITAAWATALEGTTTDVGDYVAATDYDANGTVDLAARLSALGDLYRNSGTEMVAVAAPDFVASNANKGGTVFCDFDGDGDFDLFSSDGTFTDAGVNRVWVNDGGAFTATNEPAVGAAPNDIDGVACGDVDNDGDVDLFLSNTGADLLYVNQLAESGSLAFVEEARGITGAANGEGADFADYDNDGDLDLLVNQTAFDTMGMRVPATNELYVNGTNDDAYLAVRVLADVGECPGGAVLRDDVGAVVILHDGTGAVMGARDVNAGRGHGQQPSPVLHFGLPGGPDATYRVETIFQHPSGGRVTIRVQPSSLGAHHLFEIVSTDPDADSIRSDDEGDADPDGDGIPASADDDSDNDGMPDAAEAGDADPCTEPVDSDDDGMPDYLDDDGMRIDAGAIDAGTRSDAGPPSAADASTGFQAHGSGCIQCHAGRTRVDFAPASFAIAFAAWRLSRRLTRAGRGARAARRRSAPDR
jgi:hypothetical protein